jgi:hypothetical protein
MLNGFPSQVVISYTGGTGSPVTVQLPIPQNGSVAGTSQTQVPMDYTLYVKNLMLAGGFWNGLVFVPWSQITSITAS